MKISLKKTAIILIGLGLLTGGILFTAQQSKQYLDPVGLAVFYNQQGNMITAKSVTDRCAPDSIHIRDREGELFAAKIIAQSKRYGLTALSTEHPVDNYASIEKAPNGSLLKGVTNQSLFSAAYKERENRDLVPAIVWGIVEDYTPDKPNGLRVEIGLNTLSGGGVALGVEASLIGIIAPDELPTHLDEPTQTASTLIDAKTIAAFLEEHKLPLTFWKKSDLKPAPAILIHARRVTGLLYCKARSPWESY